MFNHKYSVQLTILAAVVLGFVLGWVFPRSDTLPAKSGCMYIARLHQDYLMREYGINFMETDTLYPNRFTNQRATNLNAKLLEICMTDPTKE